MLDTTFLLETNEKGWPMPLAAPFPDACKQANWSAQETKFLCSTGESRYRAKRTVPVGSIGFIDQFLDDLGLEGLAAMNIPPELEREEFLGRQIFRDVQKKDIPKMVEEYGPLLVKPGRRPKLFEATRSNDMAGVTSTEPLFVSQMLPEPIVAEWRVFVLHGRVVGIRPYILGRWICPDQATVEKMAWPLFGYGAAALDVGVLESGRTVVIECHPFIACGLYGFEGPDLLRMAKAAWMAELRRQGYSF